MPHSVTVTKIKRKNTHAFKCHQGWSRGAQGCPQPGRAPPHTSGGAPAPRGPRPSACPRLSRLHVSLPLPRGPGLRPSPSRGHNGSFPGSLPASPQAALGPAARPWRGQARDPPAPRCGPAEAGGCRLPAAPKGCGKGDGGERGGRGRWQEEEGDGESRGAEGHFGSGRPAPAHGKWLPPERGRRAGGEGGGGRRAPYL